MLCRVVSAYCTCNCCLLLKMRPRPLFRCPLPQAPALTDRPNRAGACSRSERRTQTLSRTAGAGRQRHREKRAKSGRFESVRCASPLLLMSSPVRPALTMRVSRAAPTRMRALRRAQRGSSSKADPPGKATRPGRRASRLVRAHGLEEEVDPAVTLVSPGKLERRESAALRRQRPTACQIAWERETLMERPEI